VLLALLAVALKAEVLHQPLDPLDQLEALEESTHEGKQVRGRDAERSLRHEEHQVDQVGHDQDGQHETLPPLRVETRLFECLPARLHVAGSSNITIRSVFLISLVELRLCLSLSLSQTRILILIESHNVE